MPLNACPLTATLTTTAGAATVTVTGVAGKNYQVVNYSGGSLGDFKIELKFGSDVKLTNYGLAKTSYDEDFHDWGPVAGQGVDLTCVVTPTGTEASSVNLVYLITTI